MFHISVLQKEVIEYLNPKPNENFIDCTINGGGHTLAILEKTGPKGKILGIDWDPEQITELESGIKNKELKKRLILLCDNFSNLKEIVRRQKNLKINGVLFDLGFSSWHLEKSGRGFSFLKNEPLDMRYGPENPLTAEKIINFWSGIEIERILRDYGEERFAKQIAKNIIDFRQFKPIKSTFQLVEIIRTSLPARTLFPSGIKKSASRHYERGRIHPATRTFQALRIAVNDELNNLEKGLSAVLEVLDKEGRLVVISFHSLEDRIVKNFFKEKSKENLLKIITKKPIIPSLKEIKINPRSRSAKLRAVIKLSN